MEIEKKLMRLLFIYRNVIYFVHNSAFQVPTGMCTAGRQHSTIRRLQQLRYSSFGIADAALRLVGKTSSP